MHPALKIEVTRGDTLESEHRADAVVMHADGQVEAIFGNADRLVFPRSAIKPLQALPLVESGAADAFALEPARLALACASHDHEPVHVATVRAWLGDIGCSASDLGCGVQPPDDQRTIATLAQRGEQADPVYNNCSGKHTGFLTVARHLGEPLAGYVEHAHPVQARVRRVLGEMSGLDADNAPWARDGCSIPTLALPLAGWALAMARMTGSGPLADSRASAATRLSDAIAVNPVMIGGQSSWDTRLITATAGRILAKTGAEGVACGWLPGTDLGFCLKVADGSARAVPVAVGLLVRELGWLDTAGLAACEPVFAPRLRNWNGYEVGMLRGGT